MASFFVEGLHFQRGFYVIGQQRFAGTILGAQQLARSSAPAARVSARGFSRHEVCFSGLLIRRSQAVDEALLVPETSSSEALLEELFLAIERRRPDIVIHGRYDRPFASHGGRAGSELHVGDDDVGAGL